MRFLCATVLFLSALSTQAEVPTLDYLFPAGAQRDTTNTITVGGKFDPWPPEVWIDSAEVRFTPQTNKGTFKVEAAKTAPVGPHLLRIYNSEGASALRWFIIGEKAEVAEKEPNDTLQQAQSIDGLPLVINGRLEKNGDIDCYAANLEAGKWIIAAVDAYALGSPIDVNLHLLDDRGLRVAFNSDWIQTLDPFLAWKVEKSGVYVLQMNAFAYPPAADVRFAGSPAAVYRLTLTQGPVARSVFPAGAKVGCKTVVKINGWNFDPSQQQRSWELDLSASDVVTTKLIPVPQSDGKLRVVAGELPEQFEKEPNNSPAQAEDLKWPVTINGRIDPPGDQDRFILKVKKGERIEFRVRSGSLGFPLDGFLRIEDAQGKQVARDDDGGQSSDPFLLWTAPSNGTYQVVVADLFHQGGADFVYRLDVQSPVPDFRAFADASAYKVDAGKTNEIKLTINRLGGHTNKLVASFADLPEGLLAGSVEIKAKEKEAKLMLSATADARPFSGLLRIEVADPSDDKLKHLALFDLRPKESRVGEMLISQTDKLWLTVTTNSPPAEKTKAK